MAGNNIHLVGSIGLDDSEKVFRTLAETLGEKAKRYPDGETGARTNWITWQEHVFRDHEDLEPVPPQEGMINPRLAVYRLRDGVNPAAVTFQATGYDSVALESWRQFARLKEEGVIPETVRFQVSLPTPFAVLNGFVPTDGAKLEAAFEHSMEVAVQNTVDGIPHDQLAIQWDIAVEVIGADGGPPMFVAAEQLLDHAVAQVERLSANIPAEVPLGIHLCYGDPGHKHVVEPGDTSVLVRFANGFTRGVSHELSWIHMPVPRDRNDDAYFAPLRKLNIGNTELILGLVHVTGGIDATLGRMKTASRYVSEYGIATECGFGRRPANTIPELLAIHVEAAG